MVANVEQLLSEQNNMQAARIIGDAAAMGQNVYEIAATLPAWFQKEQALLSETAALAVQLRSTWLASKKEPQHCMEIRWIWSKSEKRMKQALENQVEPWETSQRFMPRPSVTQRILPAISTRSRKYEMNMKSGPMTTMTNRYTAQVPKWPPCGRVKRRLSSNSKTPGSTSNTVSWKPSGERHSNSCSRRKRIVFSNFQGDLWNFVCSSNDN